MRKITIALLVIITLSCNNSKKADESSSTAKETTDPSKDMDDGIIGGPVNEKSFMLSCTIDANNSLQTKDANGRSVQADPATVKNFCECAFQKTPKKYPGEIIADRGQLENDSLLAGCFKQATQ